MKMRQTITRPVIGTLRLLTATLTVGLVAQAYAAEQPPRYIWIEGESATAKTFPEGSGWKRMESDSYSGGVAIGAYVNPDAPTGTASWSFDCAVPSEYEMWARIGWRHWNDFEWRIDDNAWQVSTAVGGNYDFIKLRDQGDHGAASWICWGQAPLTAGKHRLEIRLKITGQQKSAQQFFDSFCFYRGRFIPTGKYRPDEKVPSAAPDGSPAKPDWWVFRPEYPEGKKKILDFSQLLEPLGAHGTVTVRDSDLFFEDGTPVRFWGNNISYCGNQLIYMDKHDADRLADHLAQLSINCMRIHILHCANSLLDMSDGTTQKFDALKVDRLMYVLHALEKRGIYLSMDFNYHRYFLEGDKIGPELIHGNDAKNYNVSHACGAAAFWHPRAIELNLELMRKFLELKNPYNGKRLLDSPQMAMMTIQNEQSIFWYSTNARKGETAEILDKLFTEWLRKRYGTQAELAKAWDTGGKPGGLEEGESLDAGIIRVGNWPPWHNTQRTIDLKKFFYDLETGFYERWMKALRAWGVKCPIITSNWLGGGNTTRLVLQASTVGDIVDRHNYFGGPRSMITSVGSGIPMEGFNQQAGKSFSISEWNHHSGGNFEYESVPLVAVVAAIQGWDGMFQYACGGTDFSLGLQPAHALLNPFATMIWGRRDIATGPVVFERRRDPEYQFGHAQEARVVSADPAARSEGAGGPMPVPPEVLGIGRVQNAYVEKFAGDFLDQALVDKCWDKTTQIVTSAAGDVQWRYGEGWIKLLAPRIQGGFGAIGGREIVCQDVAIQSPNSNATILAGSLDGKPLKEARRIVVSAVGRCSLSATVSQKGAKHPVPPFLMEPVTGEVSINTGLGRVRAVSATGYHVADIPATREGGRLVFAMTGQPGAVYYLIDKQDNK